MKSLLLAFALIFTTQAYAQEAAQIMARIRAENRARFDAAGILIPNNDAVTARFSANQKAAIARLRSNGNLGRSFRITNNSGIMSSLVITVTLVQETDKQLAGLLVERNRYQGPLEEASLRLFNVPLLVAGARLLSYNGVALITLMSENLAPATGGRLTIKYPTDVKKNTFSQASFEILRASAGGMAFFTAGRRGFAEVSVDVWVNIFAQNMGVNGLTFK